MAADKLVQELVAEPFSKGRFLAPPTSTLRQAYQSDLQQADTGAIKPLLDFGRS